MSNFAVPDLACFLFAVRNETVITCCGLWSTPVGVCENIQNFNYMELSVWQQVNKINESFLFIEPANNWAYRSENIWSRRIHPARANLQQLIAFYSSRTHCEKCRSKLTATNKFEIIKSKAPQKPQCCVDLRCTNVCLFTQTLRFVRADLHLPNDPSVLLRLFILIIETVPKMYPRPRNWIFGFHSDTEIAFVSAVYLASEPRSGYKM